MIEIGRQFPDKGLMLAVLDGLIRGGTLSEDTIEDALSGIADNDYDLEPEGDAIRIEGKRAREAMDRLSTLEIDEADLAFIQDLDFDGGNDIYMCLEGAIDIDTGGEEDWYQLEDLEGFSALPQCHRLDLDGHGYRKSALDLEPLRDHPALEQLTLTGECHSAGVLKTLPRLRRLDVRMAKLDAPEVIAHLKSGGVEVKT
jgi:hypothetical protein